MNIRPDSKRVRMFAYERLLGILKSSRVEPESAPWAVRDIIVQLLQTMYIDREPLEPFELCQLVRIWPAVNIDANIDADTNADDDVGTYAEHTSDEQKREDKKHNIVPFEAPDLRFEEFKEFTLFHLRDLPLRLEKGLSRDTEISFTTTLLKSCFYLIKVGVYSDAVDGYDGSITV
jgi:hypothetical protein